MRPLNGQADGGSRDGDFTWLVSEMLGRVYDTATWLVDIWLMSG